ncbi:hypothetical protein [Alteraurantiacibacter aquimixticola]|uniref:Secreted protein n=1 Tax=Alteraurantiacibacter aquimixticola TaxID=2489173 RepID=A0A4T3EZF4_9SPHN|nr:hypothetical protein [Alteraurantiacibacter aquimixticola]TIX50161.1 hypothetical protein E5222_07655 [Alteraurantiacibacter aquimixticola]
MKAHFFAAATLAFGTTAALAQEAEQDPAEQQATAAAQEIGEEAEDEEADDRGSEVVCRTERVTGSLTRRTRTCLTRDEWAEVHSRTRNELDSMGRRASGSQCIPDNPVTSRC